MLERLGIAGVSETAYDEMEEEKEDNVTESKSKYDEAEKKAYQQEL